MIGIQPWIEEAACLPVLEERLAEGVARFGEEAAVGTLAACRLTTPVASGAAEHLIAKPAEQNVIWRGIGGVALEALPLEVLYVETTLGGTLGALLADRQAENAQGAIAFPEVKQASGDREAGLREGARALCRGCG